MSRLTPSPFWIVIVLFSLALSACAGPATATGSPAAQGIPVAMAVPQSNQPAAAAATVQFTLTTGSKGGKLAFFGVGGEIDGKMNPDLIVKPGDTVELTLLNGDG